MDGLTVSGDALALVQVVLLALCLGSGVAWVLKKRVAKGSFYRCRITSIRKWPFGC